MLFSSLEFFLFFAAYMAVHALLPDRYRIFALIGGSAVFYAYWKVSYFWLPFFLVSVAHFGLRWIMAAEGNARQKKLRFVATIVVLLAPLAFYKYTNFFYQDLLGLFIHTDGPLIHTELPLGISFVSFTLIAYIVDIYTKKFSHVPSYSVATTYTVFFPHLIAGPIMRPRELIPQFEHYLFSRKKLLLGLLIFSFGLVKKVVFADQVGLPVQHVYDAADPSLLSTLDYWLAFYAFPVQIYCDFSGYTDMAIGLALMMGIRFPVNFNKPYAAVSIGDFWNRWHMTLSHWIRDYIYIPLGGNRKGYAKRIRNLMITMGVAGLWHGASWTFILWGLLHGVGISITHSINRFAFLRWIGGLPRWVKILVTFHLVSLGWVLFRANSMENARQVFSGMVTATPLPWDAFFAANAIYLALIPAFYFLHRYDTLSRFRLLFWKMKRTNLYAMIFFFWILAIATGTGSSAEFIYFDF